MLRTSVTVPASSWSVARSFSLGDRFPSLGSPYHRVASDLPIYAPTLIRLFPLTNDVDETTSLGRDWLLYHQMAVNVLDEG